MALPFSRNKNTPKAKGPRTKALSPAAALRQSTNPLWLDAKRMLARKRFGQNFLIDPRVVDGILRCLELDATTDTVLEVGPGLGALTSQLLHHSQQLVAVELDRNMVSYLNTALALHPHRNKLTLIQQDIMAYDLAQVPAERFKVVGNLPYNISSGMLFKLAGELEVLHHAPRLALQQATFMLQKEVGQRISAKPGSKAYGPLTIMLQYWFEILAEFDVPPEAFEPSPKVQSMVVTLVPRPQPLCPVDDLNVMKRLVRASFQQRRKTLRNSLQQGTGLQEAQVLAALEACGISPKERPEQLSIEQFGALANVVSRQGLALPPPTPEAPHETLNAD